MKKILSLMISLILVLGIVGCNKTEKKAEEIKERFNMSEKGDCNFYITTGENITSENGAIPYIYLENEDTLMQIGYDAEGFDGSKLSYIYIDGELVSKETLSEDCQGTLNLEKSSVKYGKHKVEVVQYKSSESDNKEDVGIYKVAQYVVTNDDAEFAKGNEECKKQMKLKTDDKDKKEDKKESEDKSDKTKVSKDKQSDNSNKTTKKTSGNKSNTSSKKPSNENYDDSKISCPNCGRKIVANSNIEINCPYCGYYHNSNTDEEEIYDDNYNNQDITTE